MTYGERALDALGDRTRRTVFKRLRSGARSVGEIADGMDVSRPAVSQHLRVLKAARLVTDRAEGTRRLYAVDKRGLDALRSWLDGWDEALGIDADRIIDSRLPEITACGRRLRGPDARALLSRVRPCAFARGSGPG
jgi:DNA-binding transcriptional ArsR family regulator